MTKYKVGDVAALFSKPKNPTTTAGKKLQSLFEDYYSKKSKFASHSQEESSEFNKNEEKEILNDQSISKKGKKRKFSSVDDSELNENVSSKKFKELEHEDSKSNENKKFKKIKKQKDFSEKYNNDSELNGNVYSEKFKESPESSKINKDKKFKKFKMQNVFPRNNNDLEFNDKVFSKKFNESPKSFKNNKNDKLKNIRKQDFPRKNKQSRLDSFNTKSTLPNFENVSKNDVELPSALMLKNMPKDTKQNKNFIKKSKKRSLDHNSSKLSTDSLHKDSYDSDDASLKKEVEEFMQNNSEELKIENKNGNNKQEKTLNSKGQGSIGKPKKKFLSNQGSFPQKYEESSEQNVKSKKRNKRNNDFQQSFPRTKKETKPNSFNFGITKFEINHDNVEQNSASKKRNSIDQDHVKKSKKSKDRLNSTHKNSFIESENDPEPNTPKVKETAADFIRKPKNKKDGGDSFNTYNFKKSNNKVFSNINADKNFKNEGDNISNGIRKFYVKDVDEETLEGIKLPSLAEENDEKNFEERLSRTLFVGNLPKNTTKREVKNLFTTFGKIESIRLAGVETDKAKIYSKNPPKLVHSNYASDTIPGFIVFTDKQSAVDALSLSGSIFKNHHITVDFAVAAGTHKLYDDKRSIFIGNLPFNVKDESVWNAFKQCGRIEGVRVVRDRSTGLGKGFGYVLFSTVESKENAIALDGLNIEGREIRIKAVNSNKKVQKSASSPSKRDTFKSRAIRLKKNSNVTGSHKSIRKLTNKQKILHKKKKISAILQKAMK